MDTEGNILRWPGGESGTGAKSYTLPYRVAGEILGRPPAVGLTAHDKDGQEYIISQVDVFNHQVKLRVVGGKEPA